MGKTYHITHVDLDAVGCLIIGDLFGITDEDSHIEMFDYKQMHEDEEKTISAIPLYDDVDTVYYTDLNISQPIYESLTQYYGVENCFFFDHHEESQKFQDYPNVYVDMNKSGSKLFYEYLRRGKRVPVIWNDFVELVNVYDMWLRNDSRREQAENLNRLMYRMTTWNADTNYGRVEHFMDYQKKKLFSESGLASKRFFFNDYEYHQIELAKEKEDREFHNAMENVQYRIDSKGHEFMLWHGASKISYICTRMLDDNPNISYVIAVNTFTGKPTQRKINGRVSVRSREGEFSCPSLNGINGHQPAAGGEFKPIFLKNLLRGIINEIGYKEDSE